MTQDEFKAQLQTAQDMLTAVSNQRNGAQNECVQMAAQIMALQRQVKELEGKLERREGIPAVLDGGNPNAVLAPKANGHAEAQATA